MILSCHVAVTDANNELMSERRGQNGVPTLTFQAVPAGQGRSVAAYGR